MSEKVKGDYWQHSCNRCHHVWYSTTESPAGCPSCKSTYWNKPRKRPYLGMSVNTKSGNNWNHRCKVCKHEWESDKRMPPKCANARCETHREVAA